VVILRCDIGRNRIRSASSSVPQGFFQRLVTRDEYPGTGALAWPHVNCRNDMRRIWLESVAAPTFYFMTLIGSKE